MKLDGAREEDAKADGAGTVKAVAIDGPAGSGKSSVARVVAAAKGFLYVDTGAMYRAVALAARRQNCDLEDPAAMLAVAESADLAFDASGTRLLLNGEDVSAEIRGPEVARQVKFAARVPEIRARLVKRQRALAESRPVVMEGRDIATVVLPRARWKFFLTAKPEVRARRRHAEMLAAGRETDLDGILADINVRDASDFQVGPMRDALELARAGRGITLLDTSDLSPEEVVAAILARIH
ncbi:MAG: (d)CMP kinase [Planctomycetota bacterium]|jgi:cytidylate kinase|nr:(d)CMP kinase [Planctomycetota bacterium]